MTGTVAHDVLIDETQADRFGELVDAHRRELTVYCYRMLGSYHDAGDVVQETSLRAWRSRGSFEGRASLRTWLYRIATNACLDALSARARRALPVSAGPAADPATGLGPPVEQVLWLQPLPYSTGGDAVEDPAARYDRTESVTLAFTAALQLLSPRQRAVLILRDVLAWRAREVGDLLEESLPTVNSLLFRARRVMERSQRGPQGLTDIDGSVLRRYIVAWEAADVAALVALLREDVRLSMPPLGAWFAGREAVAAVVAAGILPPGSAGQWRLVPTWANGEAALAVYARAPEADRYDAFALSVVAVRDGLVAEITTFLDASLVAAFGCPPHLSSRG